jgi:hypothetical protein
MVLILVFLAGAVFGWMRARRRGGGTADRAQYAFAHGFAALILAAAFALVLGLFGFSPF